jgi:hypothetical protein
MNEMQHGMSDKIKEEVVEIKPKIVDEIKDEKRATLQEDVRREIREIEDQETRAFNLIVFNLPESEDVSSSIRKDQDLNSFYELCSIIKVQEPDIKLLSRLGNQPQKMYRPLNIIFSTHLYLTILSLFYYRWGFPDPNSINNCRTCLVVYVVL